MNRSVSHVITGAALFLALTIAVAASGAVKTVFDAGETLDYDLQWVRVTGGTARMTIGPIGAERYRMTSVGRSAAFFSRFFKVRDEIESIVDQDTFSTLLYHKLLDERGKRKDELTVVYESRHLATRKGKSVNVPIPVFDPLSLIYHLRSLDLTPGTSHQFTVLADGKVYTLTASVLQRETIGTPAGTFRTVVVEPRMESQEGVFRDEQNRLLIWYTDDERHIPVRIRSDVKIGSITASLRSVISGPVVSEPDR